MSQLTVKLREQKKFTRGGGKMRRIYHRLPPISGHPTPIQTALGIVLSTATKSKLAGVFGSYGWSGEAIDLLENKAARCWL